MTPNEIKETMIWLQTQFGNLPAWQAAILEKMLAHKGPFVFTGPNRTSLRYFEKQCLLEWRKGVRNETA